jgi:hypothetical protein
MYLAKYLSEQKKKNKTKQKKKLPPPKFVDALFLRHDVHFRTFMLNNLQ